MKRTNGTLEQIRIAEPCNASWDRMQGDERVRYCGECRKNVYNLSAMSRAEAEVLVHELEGRLCVRFYQRHHVDRQLPGRGTEGENLAERPACGHRGYFRQPALAWRGKQN